MSNTKPKHVSPLNFYYQFSKKNNRLLSNQYNNIGGPYWKTTKVVEH